MTSNVRWFIKQMGADANPDEVRRAVLSELDRQFRPEFLNRLDEIILFHNLTRDQIVQIVDIQLARLTQLLEERRITIELTSEAKELLADRGFDPVFGVRPLKRAIQRYLQDPLAVAILDGHIQEGDHLVIDAEGDELIFTPVVRSEVV
jgi:ATP-dependent Clp protease ATP-binding subunit ClpB